MSLDFSQEDGETEGDVVANRVDKNVAGPRQRAQIPDFHRRTVTHMHVLQSSGFQVILQDLLRQELQEVVCHPVEDPCPKTRPHANEQQNQYT